MEWILIHNNIHMTNQCLHIHWWLHERSGISEEKEEEEEEDEDPPSRTLYTLCIMYSVTKIIDKFKMEISNKRVLNDIPANESTRISDSFSTVKNKGSAVISHL